MTVALNRELSKHVVTLVPRKPTIQVLRLTEENVLLAQAWVGAKDISITKKTWSDNPQVVFSTRNHDQPDITCHFGDYLTRMDDGIFRVNKGEFLNQWEEEVKPDGGS